MNVSHKQNRRGSVSLEQISMHTEHPTPEHLGLFRCGGIQHVSPEQHLVPIVLFCWVEALNMHRREVVYAELNNPWAIWPQHSIRNRIN